MGCVFGRAGNDHYDAAGGDGDNNSSSSSTNTTIKDNKGRGSASANDIIVDDGTMIRAMQVTAGGGGHANESLNDANDTKNARHQKQQQHQHQAEATIMQATIQAKSANKLKLVQSLSQLFSLLAQGRKVIQSAKAKVNALESLDNNNNNNKSALTNQQQKQSTDASILCSSSNSIINNSSSSGTSNRNRKKTRDRMRTNEDVASRGESVSRDEMSTSSVITTANSTNEMRIMCDNNNDSSLSSEDVILFTSIQQLCMKVVNGSIIRNLRSRLQHRTGSNQSTSDTRQSDKAYCVFLFGSQGSCKGELAFDLVQHSALLRTIAAALEDRRELEKYTPLESCPLYHHIDVAALIISNIDARIREYLQLQSQALQCKQLERQPREESSTKRNSETSNETLDNNDRCLEDTNEEDDDDEKDVTSISSELSNSASMQFDHVKQVNGDDDFALVTLSTKQRSVLELKLIKYSNCVSPKWIMDLIEAEIDRLECRVQQSSQEGIMSRERVYLINLVPNQLSLFKCCLYLHQQELRLKEFKYRVAALKFERRINIKVMTKERAVNKKSSSSSSSTDNQNNKSTIKTITSGLSISKKQQQRRNSDQDNEDKDKDLTVIATDALASGLNEKLGPKLNDVFVEQFKSVHRLYRARYNRSEDYDDHDIGDDGACSSLPVGINVNNNNNNNNDSLLRSNHERHGEDGPMDAAGERQLSVCKSTEKVLSSSMQNLHLLSPASETSETNQQPRLSLCVSPPSASDRHQLSPGSLLSLSSSADNSLASNSLLTTSGESLSSLGRPSAAETTGTAADYLDDLERVVEIQLVDLASEQNHLSVSDNQHYQTATKTQRWRFGHFGPNSIDDEVPTALAYYPQPRRGFSPLVVVNHDDGHHQMDQNQHRRSLLGSSNRHCYQLIESKILEEDQNPDLPARKEPPGDSGTLSRLEVKRIHSRSIKPKSVSDLEKLAKLIKKARRQLDLDTERWLAEAIVFNSYRLLGPPDQDRKLATARFSHTPNRVIYTLRLDVSRLKRGQLTGMPDNIDSYLMQTNSSTGGHKGLVNPRDKSPVRSILKLSAPVPRVTGKRRVRPVSAEPESNVESSLLNTNRLELDTSLRARPASSLAIDSVGQIDHQQRPQSPKHVQFRLARQRGNQRQMAAGGAANTPSSDSESQSQKHRGESGNKRRPRLQPAEGERRLWVSENLFMSSSISEDKSLLDVAAALIKIYFSGQWKANK